MKQPGNMNGIEKTSDGRFIVTKERLEELLSHEILLDMSDRALAAVNGRLNSSHED